MEFTPTFADGQKVQAKESYAHILVAGEEYTVLSSEPPVKVDAFRFPEYVTVEDVHGELSQWYPWRFRLA